MLLCSSANDGKGELCFMFCVWWLSNEWLGDRLHAWCSYFIMAGNKPGGGAAGSSRRKNVRLWIS